MKITLRNAPTLPIYIALLWVLLASLEPSTATAAEDATSSANNEEFVSEEEEAPETFYGFVDHYFIEDNPTTNRALAAISSFLVPGAGQLINKEYLTSAAHFGFFGASLYLSQQYEIDEQRRDYVEGRNKRYIYISGDSLRRDLLGSLTFNTRLYSSFDAYRTASRLQKKAGGRVPISQESFGQLALAPFTPRYFSKPLVFAPVFLLGAYYLGRDTAHSQDEDLNTFILDGTSQAEIIAHGLVQYEGVAVGEEAFYRGILNTEFIRAFGVYPGIFFSGIAFGFSHSGEGLSANALVASTYGFYLGYLHHHYDYQLGPGVALHFWWNVIIYAATANRSREFTVPLAYFTF